MTTTHTDISALLAALDDVPDALAGDVLLDLAEVLEAEVFPVLTRAILAHRDRVLATPTADAGRDLAHLASGLRLIGDRRPVSNPGCWQWDAGRDGLPWQVPSDILRRVPGVRDIRADPGDSEWLVASHPTRQAAFLALAEALAKE